MIVTVYSGSFQLVPNTHIFVSRFQLISFTDLVKSRIIHFMILGKKSYFHKVNFQESRIKLKIIFRNLTSFHKIKFHVCLFILAYDSQWQVMGQKLSKLISLIRPQTIVH